MVSKGVRPLCRKGRIMEEEVVLCGASSYEQKFYLNPEFETLPDSIQQELQIMCVLYTEDVGGVLMVVYDEQGNLELRVDHREDDFTFYIQILDDSIYQ